MKGQTKDANFKLSQDEVKGQVSKYDPDVENLLNDKPRLTDCTCTLGLFVQVHVNALTIRPASW